MRDAMQRCHNDVVDNFSVMTLRMAVNHLPPLLVVQGRPLLLLGLVPVTGVWLFPSSCIYGILSPKKTDVSHRCCFCHVDHSETLLAPTVSGTVMICTGTYDEADAARLFCIANLLRKIVTEQ